MKKNVTVVLAIIVLSLSGLFAQRGTAETKIDGKEISVEYGRPSLQGRDMLGRLPVGQSWRMGMNDATTLETAAALDFGPVTLDPGKYTLTAKRAAEDKWHLVASGDSGTHEVPLENMTVEAPVETFTIWLSDQGSGKGMFEMAWGEMKVGAGFTVQ